MCVLDANVRYVEIGLYVRIRSEWLLPAPISHSKASLVEPNLDCFRTTVMIFFVAHSLHHNEPPEFLKIS